VSSLPPFVHGFPYLDDALKIARPGMLISPFPIVRVFSSTLLPGFIGPESSVLPVNLPPSAPPRFGVSSSIRLSVVYGNINDRTGGLPWVRRTTSLYPARLHVSSVLRISGLALSRLLDLLPNTI